MSIVVMILGLAPVFAQSPSGNRRENPGSRQVYDLSKFRILTIVYDGYNHEESVELPGYWKKWGARVEYAGPQRIVKGEKSELTPAGIASAGDTTLTVDHLLSDVDPTRFHAVYIAGGEGIAELLEKHRDALARLLNRASQAKKVISAICHAPMALSAVESIRGRRVTAQGEEQRRALEKAGAILVDEIAVTDGNLLTGQWPHLETFAVTVAEKLEYPKGGGPFERAQASRNPTIRAIDDQRCAHRFKPAAVSQEVVEQLVRSAMRTAASPLLQRPPSLKVVAVTSRETRTKIADSVFVKTRDHFVARGLPENVLRQRIAGIFESAPVIFFLFTEQDDLNQNPEARSHALQSAILHSGAASNNILLAARSLGLGVFPLGHEPFLAAEDEIKLVLGAPPHAVLTNMLAIGETQVSGVPSVMRPVSEMLMAERWNQK